MRMYEHADWYQYRPSYNRDFVKRVQAKRRKEAEQKLREERERLRAERAAKEARIRQRSARLKAEAEKCKEQLKEATDIKRKFNMERARLLEIMQEMGEFEEAISVQEIIREKAKEYGVTPDHIKGNGRNAFLVRVRHEAMAEAYLRRPDMSLTQIGKQFGNKDHTTVLSALRKAGVYKTAA